MTKYFLQIMEDTKGCPSSKRWVVLMFSLTLCGALISSIVFNTKADDVIVTSIMYVIVAGLGMSGAEHFAPNKPDA